MAKQHAFRTDTQGLESLFALLSDQGYAQMGPVVRDGAIMLGEINSFDELAQGYTDEQAKGHYRIKPIPTRGLFQYAVGPQSFKQYLHPPRRKLWSTHGSQEKFTIEEGNEPEKMVFWGVRSCDLEAIKILDRIFLEGAFVNKWYQQAREQLVIIAASCPVPSANCFCTSTNTGPKPESDFDIAIHEIMDHDCCYYILETGSHKGEKLIQKLRIQKVSEEELDSLERMIEKAASSMEKRFEPAEAADLLKKTLEHKHWDEVGSRCLSCANCTMVCPTCFCTSTEDITEITGEHSERWLRWDSCFNGDFSYIHGGKIRDSTRSRYRQWMTHKLSYWYEQFGTSGCVGCGRCITWCPVGIDIIEELEALAR
ncbi:MAG: 4Fe-4S dicluster domain-containing protein [Cyclobacteriaceae bacterium]|nr:4Fe-4S dicluster domain-containing protein [Cyclobacteriaceae bacterium]